MFMRVLEFNVVVINTAEAFSQRDAAVRRVNDLSDLVKVLITSVRVAFTFISLVDVCCYAIFSELNMNANTFSL